MRKQIDSISQPLIFGVLGIFGSIFLLSLVMLLFIFCFPGINDNVVFLKTMQGMQPVFAFALPIILLAQHYFKSSKQFLGFNLPNALVLFPLVCVLAFALIPVINALAAWNAALHLPDSLHGLEMMMREMETTNQAMLEKIMSGSSLWSLLGSLFVIALLAAVCEEIVFRGWFQKLLISKYGPHISIWVIGFFFSLIHFQFLGFFPRWLMGVILGYLYYYSGSLYIPILAHFINNAVATIAYFLMQNKLVSYDLENVGVGSSSWLAYLGLFIAGVSFWLIVYVSKRTENTIQKKESN